MKIIVSEEKSHRRIIVLAETPGGIEAVGEIDIPARNWKLYLKVHTEIQERLDGLKRQANSMEMVH